MTDLTKLSGRDLESFLKALPIANLQSLLKAHRATHGAFWTHEASEDVDGLQRPPEERGGPCA